MDFDLQSLIRPNIRSLKPYSSARHEYSGDASIFLDANENSLGSPLPDSYNRYPDPDQTELKKRIALLKKVNPNQIFLGNGSDEAIDLLFRAFCEPAINEIIITPPTYGMYEVSASIHNCKIRKVNLHPDFSLNAEEILHQISPVTSLLFLCSPNNPTGNRLADSDVLRLIQSFKGIVVLDEAYSDFDSHGSWLSRLNEFPNLVILQTFSKAWGLAGLRVGMAFSSPEINQVLTKVKAPYNLSSLTQTTVLEALDHVDQVKERIQMLIEQRSWLFEKLSEIPVVTGIFPSDANFLLVKVKDAPEIYKKLIQHKIVVRDRSGVTLCEGCLRITVGTPDENKELVDVLASIQN
jgi:histidinol-phosphate aminotransferase